MELFHTGFLEIPEPDIHHGRVNADFGQGFYLSPHEEFSRKWAQDRKGETTYINHYELDTEGLKIKTFARDEEWFTYIFQNRRGYKDSLSEYDVIRGPIANDIIFDTWGLITSGLLPTEVAMALLTIGPIYEQVVIKTERAALQLHWQGARALSREEIAGYREVVRQEEQEYQKLFAETMKNTMG